MVIPTLMTLLSSSQTSVQLKLSVIVLTQRFILSADLSWRTANIVKALLTVLRDSSQTDDVKEAAVATLHTLYDCYPFDFIPFLSSVRYQNLFGWCICSNKTLNSVLCCRHIIETERLSAPLPFRVPESGYLMPFLCASTTPPASANEQSNTKCSKRLRSYSSITPVKARSFSFLAPRAKTVVPSRSRALLEKTLSGKPLNLRCAKHLQEEYDAVEQKRQHSQSVGDILHLTSQASYADTLQRDAGFLQPKGQTLWVNEFNLYRVWSLCHWYVSIKKSAHNYFCRRNALLRSSVHQRRSGRTGCVS